MQLRVQTIFSDLQQERLEISRVIWPANCTLGEGAALQMAALRSAILLASDGITFAPIPATSKITIKKNILTITLPTGLTGNSNRIRIPSTLLRDGVNNPSLQLTTISIVADTLGPRLK